MLSRNVAEEVDLAILEMGYKFFEVLVDAIVSIGKCAQFNYSIISVKVKMKNESTMIPDFL